jgi:hypothetical protein
VFGETYDSIEAVDLKMPSTRFGRPHSVKSLIVKKSNALIRVENEDVNVIISDF